LLAVGFGFVALSIFWLRHPSGEGDVWKAWLGVIFFALCSAVLSWTLIRPMVLRLDADGFTLNGGLLRAPKRTLWRDTGEFFVYRLPRGGKMIGFNHVAGRAPASPLSQFNRTFGADGALPKSWPFSPEHMVAKLNEYRAWALAS
jgi:hypothetical protein